MRVYLPATGPLGPAPDDPGSPAGVVLDGPAGAPLPGTEDTRLGIGPILDGSPWDERAGIPRRARAVPDLPGHPRLYAIAGPGAGAVWTLGPGAHTIGRGPHARLCLADRGVSRRHAHLSVSAAGLQVADLGSENGTRLAGEAIGRQPVDWDPGTELTVGHTVLTWRDEVDEPLAVSPDGEGYLTVSPQPRLIVPDPAAELTAPTEPEAPTRAPLSVIALVAPLVVATAIALVLRSPVMLLFALMSPVLMAASWLGDRVRGRKSHRQARRDYQRDLADYERQHAQALTALREHRHRQAPDLAAVVDTALRPGRQLWQRRGRDGDAVTVRVGRGTESVNLAVGGADRSQTESVELTQVPAVIDLRAGTWGLAAPEGPLRQRMLASVLAQLAVWLPPGQASMTVLSAATPTALTWSAALPHLRTDGPGSLSGGAGGSGGAVRRVGLTRRDGALDQIERRVAELTADLAARAAAVGGGAPTAGDRAGWPARVVVLDGAAALHAVPGVADLIARGPAHGIHLLCCDEPDRLPPACTHRVVVADETTGRIETPHDRRDIVPELLDLPWAARLAHALGPLREAAASEDATSLPSQVRLLDLLPTVIGQPGLPGATGPAHGPDPARVDAGWRRPGTCTQVPLGVGASGPVTIDLATDGPHALIAGTTGSGKSELLQTLVAGLAAANPPHRMGFVLVDYKGGAAFGDLARLPHTLGLTTDLDPASTRRALASLHAELRRRERVLADAGVADLAALAEAGLSDRLGRLVIVVDEFRALAEELPDFVKGLVRVAALGRSLGVHLVLATQRPAGIVSADIKANMNLRIALRLRDRGDSLDVLDAPDAASVPANLPGWAHLRTGPHPVIALQTARIGGPAPGPADTQVSMQPVTWENLGDPWPAPPERAAAGPSDLVRLVDTLVEVCQRGGWAVPPAPWLPPLPDRLELSELPPAPDRVRLGTVDLPERQAREPLTWHTGDGHLGIVGGPGSGRSTLLHTVAHELDRLAGAGAATHLHVVAAGAGAGDLRGLPIVGTVVTLADPDLVQRLIDRLDRELARRRTAASGDPTPRPVIVFAVDGWESLQALLDTPQLLATGDKLAGVLRDGPGFGMVAVLAGGAALLSPRIGPLLGQRVVLRLSDPVEMALAGLPRELQDGPWPPGRGWHPATGAMAQCALAAPVEARIEARAGARAGALAGDGAPWQLRPVPARVGPAEWAAAWTRRPPVPDLVPFAVGGDDAALVGLDLGAGQRTLLIAGDPGTGKSTAAAQVVAGLRATGRPVAWVRAWHTSAVADPADCPGDLLRCGGAELEVLEEWQRDRRGFAVVVDDLDRIDLDPAVARAWDTALASLARNAPARDAVVVATCTLSALHAGRGAATELAAAGVGLLLGAAGPADAARFGAHLAGRAARHPGRGMFMAAGVCVPVQLAQDCPARPAP